MISEAQKSKIHALTKAGSLDFESVLDLAEEVVGSPITKLDDLDSSDASALIDRLEDGRL